MKRSVLFLSISLIAIIAAGCSNQGPPVQIEVPLAAPLDCLRPICEEVVVSRGDITISAPAVGILRYVNKTDLLSRSSGRIATVDVKVGDVVKQGQVMANLDPSPLELAVLMAKAALQEAEGTLAGLVPWTALNQAEEAVSYAQSKVASAQEKLTLAGARPAEEELEQIKADFIAAEMAVQEALTIIEPIVNISTTQNLDQARLIKASTEVQLKVAEDAVASFTLDLARSLAQAHLAQAGAEVSLEAAEEAWSDFIFAVPFTEDALDPIRLLAAGVDTAQVELIRAEDSLSALEQGYELLKDQELEVGRDNLMLTAESLADIYGEKAPQDVSLYQEIVTAARAKLEVVEETVAALGSPTNPQDRALLETRLATAQAKLITEEQVREAIIAGADPLEVALVLAGQVALARADLSAVSEWLAELEGGSSLLVLALQDTEVALAGVGKSPELIIRQAQLGLKKAEEEVRKADERLKLLSVAPDQLEIELRRKEVEVAQDNLAAAEWNLNNATIVAPHDGIVSAIGVEKLQPVVEGNLLVQVLDTNTLQVVAVVDETEIRRVKEGQDANITIRAVKNATVHGRVVSISRLANGYGAGATYEVVISGEALLQSAKLREGMTAYAEIIIDERSNVLLIPSGALGGGGVQSSVEVVEAGKVTPVNVTSGLTNGRVVEIKEGLREWDLVRVNRANRNILGNNPRANIVSADP